MLSNISVPDFKPKEGVKIAVTDAEAEAGGLSVIGDTEGLIKNLKKGMPLPRKCCHLDECCYNPLKY